MQGEGHRKLSHEALFCVGSGHLSSPCLRVTAVFAELLLREVSQVVQSKLGPSTVAVAIACSVLNWLPRCSALAKHKPLLERLALEICRCCACH